MPANLRDNYDFLLERPIGNGFHNVINGFYLAMLGHINKIRLIFVEDKLQDAIETKNLICKKKFTAGGLHMSFFAGYVLKMSGENAKLEELVADDDAWINMIKKGATTCLEAWGKEQKWNTSLFHPCGGTPIILLD